MPALDRVAAPARLVRLVVLSFVVSLGPAYVALQEFDTHYGVPGTVATTGVCDGAGCRDDGRSTATGRLVDALEDDGHACGTKPFLTDVVVVEREGGGADVVTFDEAVTFAAERAGWVRAYCAAPLPR